MSQLNDKLTKTVAEAVKGVTTVSTPEMLNEAKYEPAAPDPELVAKRKARESAAAKREEERERKENEFGGGEEKKKPTVHKVAGRAYGGAAQKDDIDESVEQIDETPVTKAKQPYRPGSVDPTTGKTREAPKGTYAYDKAKRMQKEEFSFTGLVESYKEGGIKSLFQNLVKEEATEDEFNAELKKQKDKAEGKAPQADVAAAATQGTKDMKESTHTEIQVVDLTDAEDIKTETIDLEEKTLTEPETAEKERITKGMKKGIEGFKQRYGSRAKEVMFATATKLAKKD